MPGSTYRGFKGLWGTFQELKLDQGIAEPSNEMQDNCLGSQMRAFAESKAKGSDVIREGAPALRDRLQGHFGLGGGPGLEFLFQGVIHLLHNRGISKPRKVGAILGALQEKLESIAIDTL